MMVLTADFHTHILPEIDDGSSSVDDSIAMIRQELADGVDTIFLTPHFYPHEMYPESFLRNRQIAMDRLCNAFPADIDLPKFILGAEVFFCPGMSQWEQLNLLTLGKSKYILIEMPFCKWTNSTYEELRRINQKHGLTPILAHVERYLTPLNMHRIMNRLSDLPVLLQCNCEYITDMRTQRTALKFISKQKIHLVGSDCHNLSSRPPVMSQARDVLTEKSDQKTLFFLSDIEKTVICK